MKKQLFYLLPAMVLASCFGGGNQQQANNQVSDSLVAEVQEEELGDMEPEGCEPDDSFYLDLTVDTVNKKFELFMDYPGDSGTETKEYSDLPFVFTDFEAKGFNKDGNPVTLRANVALGFKGMSAENIDDYDPETDYESSIFPNGIIKKYIEEMPEIPDWFEIDLWSLEITKSIKGTNVYDNIKRVSDSELEYTCEWNGKVQHRKRIPYKREASDMQVISEEYSNGTAMESEYEYMYNGDVPAEDFSEYFTPISRLAKWVFAQCPNYYESQKARTKQSLGFADVYYDSGYEYQCGAHGMGGVTTVCIAANGDTLKVNDVLRADLMDELVEKLFDIYGEDYQISSPEVMYPSSFYLQENQLTLYWSYYEIAPYSSGQCEMELPYKEYKKYLTENFKKILSEAGKL